MQRAREKIVGGVVLVLVAAWLLHRGAPSATASDPKSSTATLPGSNTAPLGANNTARADAPNALPNDRAAVDESVGGPRTDRRSLEVMSRFQFESLPIIDGCFGPTRASRGLANVVVRFERVDSSSSGDVFAAKDVRVPPSPADAIDPHARACLDRLVGRAVVLPTGAAPAHPSTFIQPLTLVVPTNQKVASSR